MMRILAILLLLIWCCPAFAQEPPILLRPAQVFHGVSPTPHQNWEVLVRGDRIVAAGRGLDAPADARVIDLPGMTLMPGLIEGFAWSCKAAGSSAHSEPALYG